MKHLLFQISAPIQSWGNEHARQERPSDDHPRKSGILGLLGAATGKGRADGWHREIAESTGFATLVLRPGHRMVDYHTVLTPRGVGRYATRREEVEASDYTVETEREYLSDSYFLVALWAHQDLDLSFLSQALEQPVFELFAGRKACVLALPPAPLLVDTSTLREAFLAYKGKLYEPLLEEGPFRIYWEDHPSSGLTVVQTVERHDQTVDRMKHRYRVRQENEGSFSFEEAANVPV